MAPAPNPAPGAPSPPAAPGPLVLTIGHSNRTLPAFVALLAAHGVTLVADVRSHPASRRHPHFAAGPLAATLAAAGCGYRHLPDLGGLRAARADSPHLGLPAGPFRGYADHMQGGAFAAALAALLALAARGRVAAMCAEADPANCHRRLLADALLVAGARVEHVLEAGTRRPHTPDPGLVVERGRLLYLGVQPGLPGLG